MRKTYLRLLGSSALVSAALLGGCTPRQLDDVCKREVSARAALDASEARALAITDGVKREAALGAIRTARAALDKCPVAAPPAGAVQ
ncbi:hypothetical protein HZY97_16195 [Sphingomonas sp. R-74633]|uniref:hypothetical protein n=1 Tax=Sphingomonas sp. R-74633 TaxID=2751188 RepID=UPI0015D133B0|nr:hypothetical protein [Sphingomonas sp. R-74633]NYT42314.1 hypothetical protein [Sphingomonas sp. R-74633]